MLFTQFEFIFLFLPVTFIGYFVVGRCFAEPAPRLTWLTAASLVFYANWDISFVPIIATSIVANYVLGLLIARHEGAARTRLFAAAATANLVALAFFKYTNFGIDILDAVTHAKHPHLD